jgi:hypothetical protein
LQGFERFTQINPVRNIPRHDHLGCMVHLGQIGTLGVAFGGFHAAPQIKDAKAKACASVKP